jgi:hypothetical protein
MLTCSRGTLNLGNCFITASVYESIFTPGIICDISVLDSDDQLGNLILVGDETVTFSFSAPGGDVASYTFHLNSVEDNHGLGFLKAKAYMLRCVSVEAIAAKANYISKNYNTLISSMVKDIHTTFLGSSKSLTVEPTDGPQTVTIPNKKPYEAIDMVRRRATSSTNKSSNYIYFENSKGFKFVTIDGLMTQGPVKYFYQSDTVGSDFRSQTENNIIHFEIIKQADAASRVSMGGLKQQVASYDFRTRLYTSITKDMSSIGNMNSSSFKGIFGATSGLFSFIPTDSNNRQQTNIDTTMADKMASIANLTQITLQIRVNGDCKVNAGDVINLSIPQKIATTGAVVNDPLINGNFLVSRIHREIGPAADRPRYTDTIELIRGTLSSGVS